MEVDERLQEPPTRQLIRATSRRLAQGRFPRHSPACVGHIFITGMTARLTALNATAPFFVSMGLRLVPVTLAEAKAFVGRKHRHHAPPVGHRWSVGCALDGAVVGVCVVGRPGSRVLQGRGDLPYDLGREFIAEVTRLATDGTRNACTILYSGAARSAEAMGYDRIITYTLLSEPGTSLKAAGWTDEGEAGGGEWKRSDAPQDLFGNTRRRDQPEEPKRRWSKTLRPTSKRRLASTPERVVSESSSGEGCRGTNTRIAENERSGS